MSAKKFFQLFSSDKTKNSEVIASGSYAQQADSANVRDTRRFSVSHSGRFRTLNKQRIAITNDIYDPLTAELTTETDALRIRRKSFSTIDAILRQSSCKAEADNNYESVKTEEQSSKSVIKHKIETAI